MIPTISASKVAGLIGLHAYQNVYDVMYDLMCRDKSVAEKITKLEEVAHRRPFHKVVREVLEDSDVKGIIAAGGRACQRTPDVRGVLEEVETTAQRLLNLRYSKYSTSIREQLANEVRGKVSKQRGSQNEDHILNNYETQHDVKVVDRNTRNLRKAYPTFILSGRTDGWVASENRVVDSKDRTRFFPQVPLYDEIQLRVYMEMLGCAEAELIERFPDGRTRVTKFLNDSEKWKVIQDGIEKAVSQINAAVQNEEELKRIVFANTIELIHDGSGGASSSIRVQQ